MEILFGGGWVIVISCISIYCAFFLTDEELLMLFIDRELIGSAGQRLGILIQKLIALRFGIPGIMIFMFGGTLGSICYLWSKITEYKRYKKKCRLYHEGLITNFYDIYDDHVPLLSWRRLKTMFTRKEKKIKKKYPNKRTMKRQIKESEKYWTKIQKDR